MVSPIQIQKYANELNTALETAKKQVKQPSENPLSKIYIRAVGSEIHFEVKKTGLQGLLERFTQLFSPQKKLSELKNALAAINKQLNETELTEENEPFIKNLEGIRDHVIKSLEKPSILGQKSRLERATSLAAIQFKHFTPKTEVLKEPIDVVAEVPDSDIDSSDIESTEEEKIFTPAMHSQEAEDTLIKKATTALSELSKLLNNDLDLAKACNGEISVLENMRTALVQSLELCNNLSNQMISDKAWPNQAKIDALFDELKEPVKLISPQINRIEKILSEERTSTQTPVTPTLKEHKITKLQTVEAFISNPLTQHFLLTAVASNTYNPLLVTANFGLAVAAPAIASFATSKIAEYILPENMSDNERHLASFITTMASSLLAYTGIQYASGYMMTRLETTHPQPNATMAQEPPVTNLNQPMSNLTNATQVATPVAPQQFFETAEVLPFPVTTPVEMQTPPTLFTNVTTPEPPPQVPFESPIAGPPIAKLALPMSNLTDRPRVDEATQTRTFPEQTEAVKDLWESIKIGAFDFWGGLTTPNKNIFTK